MSPQCRVLLALILVIECIFCGLVIRAPDLLPPYDSSRPFFLIFLGEVVRLDFAALSLSWRWPISTSTLVRPRVPRSIAAASALPVTHTKAAELAVSPPREREYAEVVARLDALQKRLVQMRR